jgi:hypothetical protein
VLQDPQHGGALDAELAESQRLVALLRSAVLGSPVATLLTDLPPRPAPALTRPPRESAPPAPTTSGTTPSTGGDRRPPSVPSPAPLPPPADSGPAPASPEPQPQPEPQPSSTSDEPDPASDEPGAWIPTRGNGSILPD